MVPAVNDNETEKLIREKDEEVRHADHEQDSHHQHDHHHESEHNSDHHEHSDAQPHAEQHYVTLADEALWVSFAHRSFLSEAHSGHVFWDWQWVASQNMYLCEYEFNPWLPCPFKSFGKELVR